MTRGLAGPLAGSGRPVAGAAGQPVLVRAFPRSGPAARIGWPSAAYLVLLLLVAVTCAFAVDPRGVTVPAEVGPLVQARVEQVAQSLVRAAAEDAAELEEMVRRTAGAPVADLLAEGVRDGWSGVTVTAADGTVSTAGEPVPDLPFAGGSLSRAVVPAGGGLLLVTSTRVVDRRVTVAARPALPEATADAAIWVVEPGGGAVSAAPTGGGPQPLPDLLSAVSAAAPDGVAGHVGEVLPGSTTAQIVGHAPVNLPGGPELQLLVVVTVPTGGEPTGGDGVPAAVALAAIALAGTALLRFGLVRPVQEMRAVAVRMAYAKPTAPLPHNRLSELAQVGRALAACRDALTGTTAQFRPRWLYWPVSAVVAGAVVPVLLWAVLVVTTVPPTVRVDAAALATASQRAELSAGRAAGALNAGLEEIRTALRDETAPARLATRLNALVGPDRRFRGIRVIAADGTVTGAHGRPALTGPAGRYGLELAPAAQLGVPVPTATVVREDGVAVVGEFDVRALLRTLHAPQQRIRLLDGARRTVADTSGFLALEPAADAAAVGVLAAPEQVTLAGDTLAAAAPVQLGAATALGWTLVAEQRVDTLPLPESDIGRHARLVALLAVVVALGVGAAHALWHVLPLRRAARLAAALTAGDHTTVVYPQHRDDVGATLTCLDMLRRAAYEDGPRLPAAVRPEG